MRALIVFALLAAAPAAAQTPQRVDIALSSFKFTPATVKLHHGQSYTLHFTNTADGGHDFVAKEFFAAADTKLSGGEVELHGGESRDVTLVAPAAGRYEAHCSHFLHSTMGMKASIIVD